MRIYCSSIDSNNGIFVHGDGSSDPLVGCDRGIRNIVGIRRKTSALFHEWTDDPSPILHLITTSNSGSSSSNKKAVSSWTHKHIFPTELFIFLFSLNIYTLSPNPQILAFSA